MPAALRIGLTGGVASGKTTASERFMELGVPVLDADTVARAVVAPGTVGLAGIKSVFGTTVLKDDGELDRSALRQLVFSDNAARSALEAIVHPLVRAEMQSWASARTEPYLVLVIPLLVEKAGQTTPVDRILVVDISEAEQLARLVARDSVAPGLAQSMLRAQATRAARLAAADDILLNSGSIAQLRDRVDRFHEQYLRLAGSR